ncbi:nucleotide kinase related protein [Methanothermobacter marburgensis str. Marburg]|uniref:Nucleoside-triphosphatase MTBMA_c14560 n=1 Tax=Methanothermobacter marburgensis (strain ATCC BAA-927 / DSM 2133 / JCM 14651 / NBRC 100331 / OCM 82 / Marburg) TaxID=79929 RepID=D9PXT7_METTM|nr:nucleotide kinase related protein [Methanothermobacter marburgensis str. Marburg]
MSHVKILITGRPGSGKSTLIERIKDYLELSGLSTGGIFTPEVREGSSRVGFEVVDIKSGRRGLLASVDSRGPRVGRYGVNVEVIDEIAVPAIMRALKEDDCVLIDEIAPMELKSEGFRRAVEEALDSEVPVVAAVHRKLVQSIRKRGDIRVFVVAPESRDHVYRRIIDLLGD